MEAHFSDEFQCTIRDFNIVFLTKTSDDLILYNNCSNRKEYILCLNETDHPLISVHC